MLTTQMQKWGNSYGIRIPKALIDQLELPPDTQFEIREEGGAILLIPVSATPSLEDLLAQVTPENLHGEFEFGQGVGNEAWE